MYSFIRKIPVGKRDLCREKEDFVKKGDPISENSSLPFYKQLEEIRESDI